MKHKIVFASLLAFTLAVSQAWAVSVGGRNISTIPDILKATRLSGITSNTSSNLELEKDSLLRLRDFGQLELHYNIGNDYKFLGLGTINGYTNVSTTPTHGIVAALAKTKFDENRVLIGSSRNMNEAVSDTSGNIIQNLFRKKYTNQFYDLYFVTVSKDSDGKISQSRFGAWRYPKAIDSTNSGYIKAIKTGIFVDGFDGELVVTAGMETTNDAPHTNVSFESKTVKVSLNFWALFSDESGNVQYKKLDELNKTQEGYETAPLYGMLNANDAEWDAYNHLFTTDLPPYMLIKVAVGDFNYDGSENEVAVLTADKKYIKLTVYQIKCEHEKFSISTMSNVDIYTYNNPDFITKWSYNGHNRAPGADIVAGDFDGDGKTEIAIIHQGDIPASDRNSKEGEMYHGATAIDLYTNLYKWNNTDGKFDTVVNRNANYGKSYSRKNDSIALWGNDNGFTRELYLPWGGVKAVALDLDGDGTDEIAVAGARAHLHENTTKGKRLSSLRALYRVTPYMVLVQRDNSDGKLKPANTYTYEGKYFKSKRFAGLPSPSHSVTNPYKIEECKLATVDIKDPLYAVVENEFALVAGPFFGTQGKGKMRDDLVMRIPTKDDNKNLIFFKSDGTTLKEEMVADAAGGSAFVAGDFASEGIELGTPTHIINQVDKSFMAILQAPPYHVDNISEDGTALTLEPVNFSYVKGATVAYEKSSTRSDQKNTKFDIHNSVETIFALDSDATRNIIGGYKKVKNVYGLVKTWAGFVPAEVDWAKKADGVVSKVTKFIDSCIDKVETIKQGFDNAVDTKVELKGIQTERLDVIQYVTSNQNIWRYPIISTPEPNWGINYTSIDKYVTKQDFVTFTLYDGVTDTTLQKVSFYQPTHENGNLFSYPSSVENSESFITKQRELSRNSTVQASTSTVKHVLEFDQTSEHQETKSKKVSTGLITDTLSLIDGIFGSKLANVPKNETSPTYTRRESNGDKIIFNLPNADGLPLNQGYEFEYQAWVSDNGAITCGFAVKNFNKDKNIFSSQSLYSKYPDPSFVLPYKFTLQDSKPQRPTFRVNSDWREAMGMRGVRFYAVDYNKYTSNRLMAGARYRVEIPLYNASFVAVSGVKVRLYWVDPQNENGPKTPIGESQVINMPGWDNYGNNKAWARIDFTPTMADGNYKLYAEIDYSGEEVHKKRDLAKDPGGNNEGYFEFSVVSLPTANVATTGVNASLVRASAEDYDDLEENDFPTLTYNGKTTWREFYEEYIEGTKGPITMELSLTNNIDVLIPDIEVKLLYFDNELADRDQSINDTCFVKNVMLFPYETYNFTVTIDDDFAEILRRVGRVNTACAYVLSETLMRLVMGDDVYEAWLASDDDPELEDVIDDEEESEDKTVQIVNTVITKTYSLSSDVPLFWRVEDVYDTDLDDYTEEMYDEDSYVEDSGAGNVSTADDDFEDFNVSISPSTAGTVKTNNVKITVSTVAGVTIKSDYVFCVQTSEDGETWEDEDFILFALSEVESSGEPAKNVGAGPSGSSSSGGCDSMSAAFGLAAVLAFMFKRKHM